MNPKTPLDLQSILHESVRDQPLRHEKFTQPGAGRIVEHFYRPPLGQPFLTCPGVQGKRCAKAVMPA
jgi:hypothetical protein